MELPVALRIFFTGVHLNHVAYSIGGIFGDKARQFTVFIPHGKFRRPLGVLPQELLQT